MKGLILSFLILFPIVYLVYLGLTSLSVETLEYFLDNKLPILAGTLAVTTIIIFTIVIIF